MPDLLFVYGTLQQHGGAHELLAGQASLLGPARLQGRLYQVGHYPGAVLSTCPEDRVRGELFRMRHPEVLLARLDVYEEVGPQFPEPHEYRRAEVVVMTADHMPRTAWTYLYNRCTDCLIHLASGCWITAK
ncbi:GGCT-like domain protein [Syntrophotalea carbinolica DSM 2380]|uniref:GGCT-like domain protein n=1 Tax=Syntrophotalea carbinolica (strain DSM 2380 / NBRC 103641 / GraBd1) TaxID=338963 RepID=Q3A851_SYNC1|nr:gamma-glutamylcyclotransferase family protein [Syntrophotalea carbinolica]ABA87441.1 GGCT-like domain protein [Syntrophotalea carbinolica DSM 2380]